MGIFSGGAGAGAGLGGGEQGFNNGQADLIAETMARTGTSFDREMGAHFSVVIYTHTFGHTSHIKSHCFFYPRGHPLAKAYRLNHFHRITKTQ